MKDKEIKDCTIEDIKRVWVAWTNTDLTEGRGERVPYAVCKEQATAIRLGRKKSVMGSDCEVSLEIAVKIEHTWLAPCHMVYPSREDSVAQRLIDERNSAIKKATEAGLTDADILALTGGRNG